VRLALHILLLDTLAPAEKRRPLGACYMKRQHRRIPLLFIIFVAVGPGWYIPSFPPSGHRLR